MEVPKEVTGEKSPAWNKGRFVATGVGSKVLEAYLAQFATDLDRFLKARAQEIVAGGLMVLAFAFSGGWSDLSESAFLRLYHLLEATVMDMVAVVGFILFEIKLITLIPLNQLMENNI
ncbi:loganic acid O-methyltransferase-like [Aristolochia californica]|uniref:loganic acid O-methyltransferase-like n=1 Tax=Aristolochia californica TaxID=171875 RepID=UPI0035DE4D72